MKLLASWQGHEICSYFIGELKTIIKFSTSLKPNEKEQNILLAKNPAKKDENSRYEFINQLKKLSA